MYNLWWVVIVHQHSSVSSQGQVRQYHHDNVQCMRDKLRCVLHYRDILANLPILFPLYDSPESKVSFKQTCSNDSALGESDGCH